MAKWLRRVMHRTIFTIQTSLFIIKWTRINLFVMLESSIFKLEWITFLVFWRMFTFKTETPCSSLSNRRNRSNRQAENWLYRWHATVVHFHLKSAMCWWFGYIDNSFHGIPVSNTRVWIHTDVSVVRSNSFSHFILSVSLSLFVRTPIQFITDFRYIYTNELRMKQAYKHIQPHCW